MEFETEMNRQPEKRKKSPDIFSPLPPVAQPPEEERDDRSELISSPDIPPSMYFAQRLSVANQACWYVGFFLMAVGVVGFVVPNLWDFRFSYSHNLLNLFAGVLTLWVGLVKKGPVAKRFCIWFGALYFLFGAAGYFMGDLLIVNGAVQERYVWTLIPESFVLGRWDHYLHAAVGAILMLAGVLSKSKRVMT
jgi:hypothetical protein